jgi:hypothetical protein
MFVLWILLIAILGLGIFFAIFVGLIAVPSFRKTGWTLLAFFVGIPLVLIPLLVGFRFYRSYAEVRPAEFRNNHAEISRIDGPMTPPSSSMPSESLPAPQVIGEAKSQPKETPAGLETKAELPAEAVPTPAEEPQPLDKAVTAESSKLVDLLSKALAKMIIDDPKAWKELVTKAANFNDPPTEQVEKAESETKKPEPIVTPMPTRPPKPDWVGKSWRLVNNGSEYECDVEVYPLANRVKADPKLPEAVQKAIGKLIEEFYDDKDVEVVYSPDETSKIIGEKYEEWRTTVSVGDVLALHAKVTIKKQDLDLKYSQACERYEENQRKALVRNRLWLSGEYFGVAMFLMASVWGYLRIDLTGGGKHRTILRTALVFVILSSIALAWIVGKVL